MRSLIVAVYRLVYNVTRFKVFSVVIAVAYITLLNLVMVYGLGQLMRGWLTPPIVLMLFRFPYILFMTALMTYLIIKVTPTRKTLSKDAKKVTKYTAVLIYTGLCILVLVYINYIDKIPFDTAPQRRRLPNPPNAYHSNKAKMKEIAYTKYVQVEGV